MIEKSDAYRAAITGDTRRMQIQAVVDILDPEIIRGEVVTSTPDEYSDVAEIYDRDFTSAPVRATLEPGRWLLNGKTPLFPDDPDELTGVKNYTSEEMCGEDCTFENPPFAEITFSNCDILQTATVVFSDNEQDAFPVDFKCEIYIGDETPSVAATVEIADNTERSVGMYGFTVYSPTRVKITALKMSKPYSRLRIAEIVPGIYETWSGDEIESISITQQASTSMVRLPYTTCKLTALNKNNRFSPVAEDGVFLSLQDGEPVKVNIGVTLEDGSVDWTQVGTYYQKTGGWSMPSMGLTMTWNMVDIIGLLADRKFVLPETLPTTLSGWASEICGQLGSAFKGKYYVPAELAALELTATAEELEDKTCGELLRSLALASGTYCRADAQTGGIVLLEKEQKGRSLVDFDNMNSYPNLAANSGCAQVIFNVETKSVGSNLQETTTTEQYAYPGTNAASDTTLTVDDLFLNDEEARQKAVRQIVEEYGGNKITCRWRGDPSVEAGDVVNVQLTDTVINSARVIKQEFNFKNGVMTNLKAELIQGTGIKNYENRTLIIEDGVYTVPDGVTEIYVIIIGGGDSGYGGNWGNSTTGAEIIGDWFRGSDGASGDPGEGGNVFYVTLQVTPGQQFDVEIGEGGVYEGQANPYKNFSGEDTKFGSYSSASGAKYPLGFSDLASGNVYAQEGSQIYTVDGLGHTYTIGSSAISYGAGGAGGRGGTGDYNTWSDWTDSNGNTYHVKTYVMATAGEPGAPGKQGCVIIYDTEASEG